MCSPRLIIVTPLWESVSSYFFVASICLSESSHLYFVTLWVFVHAVFFDVPELFLYFSVNCHFFLFVSLLFLHSWYVQCSSFDFHAMFNVTKLTNLNPKLFILLCILSLKHVQCDDKTAPSLLIVLSFITFWVVFFFVCFLMLCILNFCFCILPLSSPD